MKLTLKLKPRNPGGQERTAVIDNIENAFKSSEPTNQGLSIRTKEALPSTVAPSPLADSSAALSGSANASNISLNSESSLDPAAGRKGVKKQPGRKGRPSAENKPVVYLSAAELEANQLRESMERIMKRLKRRDSYGFFLQPVTEEQAPGYAFKIKQPMDLGTMERKMIAGAYGTLDAFANDFRLIVNNCFEFNPPSTRVYREAVKLSEYGAKALESEQRKVDTVREKAATLDHNPPLLAPNGVGLVSASNPTSASSQLDTTRSRANSGRWNSDASFGAFGTGEPATWTPSESLHSSRSNLNNLFNSLTPTTGRRRTGRPHKTIERTFKLSMAESFTEDACRNFRDYKKFSPYSIHAATPFMRKLKLRSCESGPTGSLKHLAWHDFLGIAPLTPPVPFKHPPFVAGTREGMETGLRIVQSGFGDTLGLAYAQSIEKFARDAGLDVNDHSVVRKALNKATLGGWDVFNGVLTGVRHGLCDIIDELWMKKNSRPIRQVSELLELYTGLQPLNEFSQLLEPSANVIELLAIVLVHHYQRYSRELFLSMKREYVPVLELVPLETRMSDSTDYLAAGSGDTPEAKAIRRERWPDATKPVATLMEDISAAIAELYNLSIRLQLTMQTKSNAEALALINPTGKRYPLTDLAKELQVSNSAQLVEQGIASFQEKLVQLRTKLFLQVARIPMYKPVASGALPDIPNTPDELKSTNDVKALQMLMRAVKPGLFSSFSGADLLLFSRLILELASAIKDHGTAKSMAYFPKDISAGQKNPKSLSDPSPNSNGSPIDWDLLHSFAFQQGREA